MSLEAAKISHTELALANKVAKNSDLTSDERERLAFNADAKKARANLDRTFPDGERNDELSKQLAWTVMLERTRREAHFYRYRLMTNAAMQGQLLNAGDNFPEISLLDIEQRTAAMSDADWQMAAVYSGKGISAELGHVDQLGDWDAGEALDDVVRALPESEALAQAGFVFDETYNDKDTARISYEFYITDGGLKAKRKRAAADVITESGTIYNIVKSSIFLVDERELPSEDIRLTRSVMRMLKDKDLSQEELEHRDNVFAKAGDSIIEPFITEKEKRERSTAVLAATSIYFALVRHP